jgi:hypothetical protein
LPSVSHAQTFNGYECTQDCSGHEAGYDWAQQRGIDDDSDCGGNSNSFIEGCKAFVDENGGPAYGEEDQDANSGYEQDGSDGEETEE